MTSFPEATVKASRNALILGIAVILASIVLGRTYAFFVSFLVFSLFITILWRNNPRCWIELVSISSATPIAIARQQVACNLVFAFWFVIINLRYFFRLPRWLYLPAILAIFGIMTSAINWLVIDDLIRSVMRQAAYAFNLFLAPFLLLPIVYMRLSESRDHRANLRGLLFCLIVPSALILIAAKLFGSVANVWEASRHAESLSEGFLIYKLGKAYISFQRTDVGFILAALICASTAIAFSRVERRYRIIAGLCLAASIFMLMATASFGSIFACLCGLAAIFFKQLRNTNIVGVIAAVIAMCCMLLVIYAVSPQNIKTYLGKRYEHRVVNRDMDRFRLWAKAVDQILKKPEGVGKTFEVGDDKQSLWMKIERRTVIHNDYLAYAVSYGIIGGLGYLILVCGLLVSFFRAGKSMIKNPAAYAVYLAGLGVIVAAAVNSVTDHMNANRWYFNVIWSMIWYSYFCSHSIKTGINEDSKSA